eukprot:scaffold10662_cov73-Isochrysis_galbana.AAC.1
MCGLGAGEHATQPGAGRDAQQAQGENKTGHGEVRKENVQLKVGAGESEEGDVDGPERQGGEGRKD